MMIREVMKKDLSSIMEIERRGFSVEEAASEAAMAERIQKIPDSFLIAEHEHQVIGFVVGNVMTKRYITDDQFETLTNNLAIGGIQSILSLAVDPAYRKLGVGQKLMEQLEDVATRQQREAISLTCLTHLVSYYEKLGYVNEGISDSQHAGEVWYNLVKSL
ncbi:GNAT family N-acetyltransferase [Kurthia senegalensis]|uniref:GNAT family N-acetyltransferase n=1 Tax=Kurthia senegalensis TaxID=1033740 RepID=UPI0002896905|nr:GNAT family N-acetyltransferase [Kurthia senegalensis]